MTANAVCSLSLDPLLALVCFENRARTLPIVRDAGRFGVNVLAADQEDVGPGVRLQDARGREARRSAPIGSRPGSRSINGALSWVACDLRS